MLSRFFGERIGGVRFFEELERGKRDPLTNYPVLELQHSCLALGFQGIHRTSAGGQSTLQQIQRDLYEVLRRVRPKVYQDLSPRWQGQALANRLGRVHVPIWAVAGVLGILLFGLFIMLRTYLGGGSDLTTDAMSVLHPNAPLTIERPPQTVEYKQVEIKTETITQLQRIQGRLAAEIAAGKVTATQSATQIFIRVGDVVLFDPGQAVVLDSFKPIIPRIAASLDPEPGNIKVIGHTDNQPIIRSPRFPSNFHLSVERARVVGALLKQSLSQPGRLEPPIGRGADAPIATNDTAQGRTRNRRVEIIIPRAD
jgi:type VI secretion system protein ImpK